MGGQLRPPSLNATREEPRNGRALKKCRPSVSDNLGHESVMGRLIRQLRGCRFAPLFAALWPRCRGVPQPDTTLAAADRSGAGLTRRRPLVTRRMGEGACA